MSARQAPDRNIALELVRVTEAAAMAAARWIGRGDKEDADQAPVDAMRFVLDSVAMRGVVVIGEGEKDEAPMLYNGEEVGSGEGAAVDVAVDPLEGTRLTALGQPGAISVIAVAERGTMLFPGTAFYMEKIAVGPRAVDAIDTSEPEENPANLAPRRWVRPCARGGRGRSSATATRSWIAELREGGARVRLIRDLGDVAPIARRNRGRGRHALRGRRRRGGDLGGRWSASAVATRVGLAAQRRGRQQLLDAGLDLARVLHTKLIPVGSGEDGSSPQPAHDGSLLQGVQYTRRASLTLTVMRSRSGTVRRVVAQQSLAKLSAMTGF